MLQCQELTALWLAKHVTIEEGNEVVRSRLWLLNIDEARVPRDWFYYSPISQQAPFRALYLEPCSRKHACNSLQEILSRGPFTLNTIVSL